MRSSVDKENMVGDEAYKSALRKTRSGYRKLGRSLEDNKSEILRPGDRILAQSLNTANILWDTVTRPQEATLDSRVLLSAADLARSKARNIKKGREVFNIDEFIGRLVTFCGDDMMNLKRLGTLCTRHAIRPPTSDFMLGPLQVERKEKNLKAREARRRSRAALVRPDNLTEKDTTGAANSNSTTKTTVLVGKLLAKNSPIDLFSFIINPQSFSQSVENMFSLSFLVKEGRAGLYENEEGMQIVRHIDQDDPTSTIPINLRTQTQNGNQDADDPELDGWEERQQGVMTLDMATWTEAIEILELKLPIIPHRQDTEKVKTSGWY
ncbi:protein of unknown function [Taphrina deformans PYCC 5710]|uniref:Non-structural maintenance of chromosomes element 4 n=1 Tax=Taphrina deformans (strain PYCC 5710 / ATCC 11124 / CBS 356.35 / IMI 108563 / JCM 9778 / NBRC 8474) TaxID=1097556 RepID=R4XCU4_TAPDE|nr:protein of unknown function [Taphrina deformans PYCC 5710]|eukprot:CCG83685.1 protein of unknown function [Taphrina deformans PYCC 5710]